MKICGIIKQKRIIYMVIKIGKYRHFKGKVYEVVAIAKHSETLEEMVVYRALYNDGSYWVRPLSMWNKIVERNGDQFVRFTYIDDDK